MDDHLLVTASVRAAVVVKVASVDAAAFPDPSMLRTWKWYVVPAVSPAIVWE